MADGIFFEKQNAIFDKLKKDLEKYSEDLVKEIDAEIFASAEEMATKAKQKAPATPSGRLRASIKVEKDSNAKLAYDLVARVRYAAYVEFGTGPYVIVNKYDSYWQDIALPFKSPNPSSNRKIQAQPFFYPTVNKNIAKLRDKIKRILSKNEG